MMEGVEFTRGEYVTACVLTHRGNEYRVGCFSNNTGASGLLSVSPGCRLVDTPSKAWNMLIRDARAKADFLDSLEVL